MSQTHLDFIGSVIIAFDFIGSVIIAFVGAYFLVRSLDKPKE